jgi:cysteinyl-tRNA synthetase
MKVLNLAAIVLLFAATACNNNSGNNAKESSKPKTHADSLMDDIMAGHDIAMGKMSKLSDAQKKVQSAIDSVNKLLGKARRASADYKTMLDTLSARLANVKDRMNNWMDTFNMDSLENDAAQRAQYLESEKSKVGTIKDDILNTLKRVDSVLKK